MAATSRNSFDFSRGAYLSDLGIVRAGCAHLARCPVFNLLVTWALVDPNLKAWSLAPGAMVRDGRFGRDIGNFCYSAAFFILRSQTGFAELAQQIESQWPSVTQASSWTGWERLGDVIEYCLGVWNGCSHATTPGLDQFTVQQHRDFSDHINRFLMAVSRLHGASRLSTPQHLASLVMSTHAFQHHNSRNGL